MSTSPADVAPDLTDTITASERTPTDARASRRNMLKLGAVAAATLAIPRKSSAQSARPGRPQPKSPTEAQLVGATASWTNPAIRLARRITMGLTATEVARAKKLGFHGYLEYQLNYQAIDDSATEAFVASSYPIIDQPSSALAAFDNNTILTQLSQAWMYRSVFSNWQLYERMVEFWSDHFNIAVSKVGYLKVADDRDVIRKYALDKFPTLLKASAHSPAMLVYLDQQTSRRGAPNQNYAREIMELHTLGVDGGYTQTDVAELSRVLTGWTTAGRGDFSYNPNLHDFEAKTVLGINFPKTTQSASYTGQDEGEKMLDVLVNHPSTARFIATKMLKWLLRYDPSSAQIANVASVYTKTGGDIKAMIRAIFEPSALMEAPAKHKRPFHFIVSALRGTSPKVTSIDNMAGRQLTVVGQPLYAWQTPDGYPDKFDYWAGNVLPRWNFGTTLSNLTTGTVIVDIAPYMATPTPEAITQAMNVALFGGEMPATMRNDLIGYIKPAPTNATRVREALALAIGSAQFQLY